MTLKIRRILSLIFIILFLAATPAIMLYAAGYRLAKNGLNIQKTGMFIIDSKPKGAKIFIDERAETGRSGPLFNKKKFIVTPAKIKNLLPGEYNLKLELGGYWSWQKKLTVNPGASTFAENIYLFKSALPAQVAPASLKSISLSPLSGQAVILSADLITFLNLADESEKTIKRGGLAGKNISLSEDQSKIIIDDYLYNFANLNSALDLKKLTADSLNYKWSGGALYYQGKNSVYRLESSGLPKKIIGGKTFNDYLVKNNYLYLISKTGAAANLEVIDLAAGESIKSLSLPAAWHYSFINPEHDLINLYDQSHKILYLIDPWAAYQPLKEIINNVKNAAWAGADNLLYTNDFEIWLYGLETKNKILLTRISDAINQASLHPSKDYLIYSTKQAIYALELDEREKRNITELVKFDSIGSFALKGNIIYFSGKIGQTEGLYKFLIQ